MIKGFLTGSAIFLTLFISYLIYHLGFFQPVEFSEETRGPYYVIYQEHSGSYNLIAAVISRVEHEVKDKKLDCSKTFGNYLDDPSVTEDDRLHSWGGCISDHPYPTGVADFKTAEFPAQKYFVARFGGSPAIGPWKVYGAAKQKMADKQLVPRGETIEVYTLSESGISTEYLFPLR